MKNRILTVGSSNSTPSQVEEFKGIFSRLMAENGFFTASEKVIPYGVQVVISNGVQNIPVNIYWSQKKGLTTVIGGKESDALKPLISDILTRYMMIKDQTEETKAEESRSKKSKIGEEKKSRQQKKLVHDWESWLGSDEAGKGDFFGALVVAGFHADRKIIHHLKDIGVQDSKKISKKNIETIAGKLYAAYKERIEVLILKPQTYNKLYAQFRDDNKKLNELMAWMHGRVILNLVKKREEKRAVVDKFTTDRKLISSLKDMQNIELLHVTHAEDDIAVAAASIIARYHYLLSLKQLKKEYKVDFASGSGYQSIDRGVDFVRKYSLDKLNEVAKTHFKNHQKIKDRIEK